MMVCLTIQDTIRGARDNMQVYDKPKPPVSPVFGCEEAVWKKDFSQRNPKTRSKVVFKNADLLGQFAAEDHDDKGHAIPPVELNGTGWMCRRVSFYSSLRHENRRCIVTGDGLTGKTFKSFMRYLNKHKPYIVIGEMVPN